MSRLLYRNNELVVICATTEKLLVLVGSLYSVHVLAPKHYSLYRTDKKIVLILTVQTASPSDM